MSGDILAVRDLFVSYGRVEAVRGVSLVVEPGRIAAVGWERNELVRLNGKWLIKVRDTAPKPE